MAKIEAINIADFFVKFYVSCHILCKQKTA